MGIRKVFYADWQMECCGSPFSVGEEVSWPLLLTDADDVLGGGWDDALSTLAGPTEEARDDRGALRLVRAADGLVAALPGDSARTGGHPSGLLCVERHSAAWAETTGYVRAIRVVRQAFAPLSPGSRTPAPVPGERSLEVVYRCPKWFGEAPSGVLVDLDVSGGAPPGP
ncbi:DUF6578 domain-containing protein [Streptomyces sp. NPDC047079]|uniref:DUF6578 domain-containing protein n=1 Tax=Streptomyces sp. NPDC047079 TaxID=3154607 RepID=UPI0033C121EC